MGKLDNKVVIITGGTSGIGKASAFLFASEGADVIILGRNQKTGHEIEKNILSEGKKAKYIYCDITKEDNIISARQTVINTYSKVDILFNNAGILLTATANTIEKDDWDNSFAVNVRGHVLMTKHFIDLLIKSKGNILNNASINGLSSYTIGRSSYAYSSSKAALIQYSQLCALNYAKEGVRVNCLCPGTTDTNLFTDHNMTRFLERIPMNRIADVTEIAKAALFLVSDDASYITGAILTVDGGQSLL